MATNLVTPCDPARTGCDVTRVMMILYGHVGARKREISTESEPERPATIRSEEQSLFLSPV